MTEEMGYAELARKTIETYIKEKRKIDPPQTDKFKKRAGAFVSIKRDGKLRGCIGTIDPTRPFVGQEIVENAISAATRDPRFRPITTDELDHLHISVDILGEKEPVEDISQLDPEEYGVIVTKNSRTGLLLPNLEGVDTVEYQLEIARKKAGISPEEEYKILRFKVERYEE